MPVVPNYNPEEHNIWLLEKLNQYRPPSSKDPYEKAIYVYASTKNWMRALAIHCSGEEFSADKLNKFYSKVSWRNQANEMADINSLHDLIMSLHDLVSLKEMNKNNINPQAIVKSAIFAWYYSIYHASSSMLAAFSTNNSPENHTGTSKKWQTDIVQKKLVLNPFGLHLDGLTEKDVKREIVRMRDGNDTKLIHSIDSEYDAHGALCGYLSGTAKWRRDKVVLDIKKNHNLKNFYTNEAKKIRDDRFNREPVNFLTQAYRYRGKANYRDGIYLTCGFNKTQSIEQLVDDLEVVSEAFVKMTIAYISKRIKKAIWNEFKQDLDRNFKKYNLDLDLMGLR